MFHAPLNQLTFEQVENFCKEFPEGVRVEYKQEPTKNIPKIVASFANTVGGIWVIGVETDTATNLPKFPLAGMKRRAGVEEQIVQSAQAGIYPAITPDVRVLDVPGKPDRMLVVVKVPESMDAPHAIENSTRVYIRNASTTEPYELADIDRIAYFIKRREQPQRANWLAKQGDLHLREFRLVHEGILATGRDHAKPEFHFEANTHGIVFFEGATQPAGEAQNFFEKTTVPFVYLAHLVYPVATVLNTALMLLKGSVTNVMLRYELGSWGAIGLLVEEHGNLINPGGVAANRRLLDKEISVSTTAVLETLPERRAEVLTEVMRQVLWAFNYTTTDLGSKIELVLKQLHLL